MVALPLMRGCSLLQFQRDSLNGSLIPNGVSSADSRNAPSPTNAGTDYKNEHGLTTRGSSSSLKTIVRANGLTAKKVCRGIFGGMMRLAIPPKNALLGHPIFASAW